MARDIHSELMDIDKKIAELIKKRAMLVSILGYDKAVAFLNSRRSGIVTSIAYEYGLPDDILLNIFSYIDGIVAASLKPLTIGFLGPRGTFTEEATLKIFSDSGARPTSYISIYDVFRAVENREVDYGVVPLENSLEGSVGETLDMLAQSNVKICGETEVRISHNLIAKSGTRLDDVKVVLSHPMAFAQCRNFIYTRLRNARIETRSSTSEAVKEAVEKDGVAAIGSELAAKLYGGEIIARGIEDYRDNYTRFIAIGFKPIEKGVNVKTSIIFTLKHVPGALYRALEPFAIRNINLTKIESRPIKSSPWEYMFFLDFLGSLEDSIVKEAIDDLKNRVASIKILGSYRKIL
jgi:prephenate dehydratase